MDFASRALTIQEDPVYSYAGAYDYDEVFFAGFEKLIEDAVNKYDPTYGPFLLAHLHQTARQLHEFMLNDGYDAETAKKISRAFFPHDVGKLRQHVELWMPTVEKPREEKKAMRKKGHLVFGPLVLREVFEKYGMPANNDVKKQLRLMRYFCLSHHERLDGRGPLQFTPAEQGRILRTAAIIDEIDGKVNKIANGKTLETALDELKLDKFDADIAARYRAFACAPRLA